MEVCFAKQMPLTLAGLQPVIFGSEDQRPVHWATGPSERWLKETSNEVLSVWLFFHCVSHGVRTQLPAVDLKSTSLDHSGRLTLIFFPLDYEQAVGQWTRRLPPKKEIAGFESRHEHKNTLLLH